MPTQFYRHSLSKLQSLLLLCMMIYSRWIRINSSLGCMQWRNNSSYSYDIGILSSFIQSPVRHFGRYAEKYCICYGLIQWAFLLCWTRAMIAFWCWYSVAECNTSSTVDIFFNSILDQCKIFLISKSDRETITKHSWP